MPPTDSKTPIYNLTLILLTGESAPQGPGWYITGTAQASDVSGASMPLRRIAVRDAEEIANTFGNLVSSDSSPIHPFRLVQEGTTRAREAVEQELDHAEKIATTVPRLRKALDELGVS